MEIYGAAACFISVLCFFLNCMHCIGAIPLSLGTFTRVSNMFVIASDLRACSWSGYPLLRRSPGRYWADEWRGPGVVHLIWAGARRVPGGKSDSFKSKFICHMTEYNSCKPYSEILTDKLFRSYKEYNESTLGDDSSRSVEDQHCSSD